MARRNLIRGLYQLRGEMLAIGITGFQWVGGSFVENVEAQELRDPEDIDVVTFAAEPSDRFELDRTLRSSPLRLLDRKHLKRQYGVDHFLLPLSSNPRDLVQQTKFWFGLFSHRRDRVWKGMLALTMTDAAENGEIEASLRAES